MYKVSICGYAREKNSAGVIFSAKLLKNGTEDHFESYEFKHGDDMFIKFRSPTDGYVAIYLIDDHRTAYCLLPYMNDITGKVKVKRGQDYLFFSKKHADAHTPQHIVDEYIMLCDKTVEYNFIYIVFSQNEFYKANDRQSKDRKITDRQTNEELTIKLPRELSLSDFQDWIKQNSIDENFKWMIKPLTIVK
jgi:hypothetical protein